MDRSLLLEGYLLVCRPWASDTRGVLCIWRRSPVIGSPYKPTWRGFQSYEMTGPSFFRNLDIFQSERGCPFPMNQTIRSFGTPSWLRVREWEPPIQPENVSSCLRIFHNEDGEETFCLKQTFSIFKDQLTEHGQSGIECTRHFMGIGPQFFNLILCKNMWAKLGL